MYYICQRTVGIRRAKTADKGTDEAGAKLVGKGDAKGDGYDEYEATAHSEGHDDARGDGYVHRYPCEAVGDGGHDAVKIVTIVLVEEKEDLCIHLFFWGAGD